MNKLVTKILKECNASAKITESKNRPKFRITNNNLTLEGIVTKDKYSMTIKDPKGNKIDSLTVSISNGNDIANRINESITTLNALSPIYDKQVKLKEDEEFVDVPDVNPGDLDGLINQFNTVYTTIVQLADTVSNLTNYLEEDDAKNSNEIMSISCGLYDVALDISDFIEDIEKQLGIDEDELESYRKPIKTEKYAIKSVINNLTEAQIMLKGHKKLNSINNAIKDIKSELIVRNN